MLLKTIGLFCKRALKNRRDSAKETYNFEEPTNRSHLIGNLTIELSFQHFCLPSLLASGSMSYVILLFNKLSTIIVTLPKKGRARQRELQKELDWEFCLPLLLASDINSQKMALKSIYI